MSLAAGCRVRQGWQSAVVSPLVLATSVAFYLDDVPIGASGRWGYAGGTALDLLPYDLERLEVQRGPQGTFGGARAEIGSIKYVLNPPDMSGFEARVGADVSTIHGASEPGESVRAVVNSPLIEDILAVRVMAYDGYTPGYIDNAYSGATDINVLRQYGGRIASLWRPTELVSLSVMALYSRIDQDSQSEVLSPSVVNVPGTGDAYIVSGAGSHGDLADSLAFLSPFEKSLDSYSATCAGTWTSPISCRSRAGRAVTSTMRKITHLSMAAISRCSAGGAVPSRAGRNKAGCISAQVIRGATNRVLFGGAARLGPGRLLHARAPEQ